MMQYYHILLEIDGDEIKETDLTKDEVESITKSYHECLKFLFDGSFVVPSDIERIKVYETNESWRTYGSFWYIIDHISSDVTKRFIKNPPRTTNKSKKIEEQQILSKNVFIVHGRDHESMNELKTMLYDFGLKPIVLHEQASGGLTIAEKLEKHTKDVGYAFAILTPDDFGCQRIELAEMKECLRAPLIKRPVLLTLGEIEKIDNVLKPRARQNVIFEMGYFWGLLKRQKVCCLLKGSIEKPSDMNGIVYIPFKDSVKEARFAILKELNAGGYNIQIK